MILIYFLGFLSISNPCFFSIIPLYVAILSKKGNKVINTLLFLIGLSFNLIFLILSIYLVKGLFDKEIFRIIAGIYIFLMGLFQLEYLKMGKLNNNFVIKIKEKYVNSYLYSLILGFTFSFGWVPCITPALSSILLNISTHSYSITYGIILVLIYFLGLITPFIIASIYFEKFNKLKKYSKEFQSITGYILILLGIMMIFNLLGKIKI